LLSEFIPILYGEGADIRFPGQKKHGRQNIQILGIYSFLFGLYAALHGDKLLWKGFDISHEEVTILKECEE